MLSVVAVKRGARAVGHGVPEMGRALNAKVRVRAVVLWLESTGVVSTGRVNIHLGGIEDGGQAAVGPGTGERAQLDMRGPEESQLQSRMDDYTAGF